MKILTLFVLALLFFLIAYCIPIRKFIRFSLRITLLVVILHSTFNIDNCEGQWVQQTLPVSGQIYDIAFFDANTGLVSMYNSSNNTPYVLRTTNGGNNWISISNAVIYKLKIIDSQTVYGNGIRIGGPYKIYRTFDRGINWDSVAEYTGYLVYTDISFINQNTGWISGFDGNINRIYKTTNGGVNIFSISSNTGFGDLFFLKQPVNGEYYGWNVTSGYLFQTTNSGVNWTSVNNGVGNIGQVFFLNKDTGWCTAGYSSTYITTNGGINWIVQFYNSNSGGEIYFANYRKGWQGGYQMFATTDGGTTWGTQNSPLYTNTQIAFVDTLTGWTGTVYLAKTTNGGGLITYIGLDSNNVSVPRSYTLKQNYPNPFNPQTTIEFSIKENSSVNLIIYDITGKEIFKIMESSMLKPGNYKAVLDFSKIIISSGVYFYTIIISDNKSKQVFKE
ncbi:MAG: T9SS type A sorting domain-containing protein, partial [Ignavibacteriae bacterium]|nr:T9SS type A sorting domain-containing protein [Ignavibacteriota bacterium]